jgi:hypothetical protein
MQRYTLPSSPITHANSSESIIGHMRVHRPHHSKRELGAKGILSEAAYATTRHCVTVK